MIPTAPVSVMYSIELLGIEVDGCKVMVTVLAVLLAMELPSEIFGLEVPRLFTIAPIAGVEMKPAEQVSTVVVTAKEFEAG